MMYRRNAAQTPRVHDKAKLFATMAAGQILGFLASIGLYEQAHRENRKRIRYIRRGLRHTSYFANGLNGPRAVARRRRQRLKIEARQALAA